MDFKKLHPQAQLPIRQSAGAAGYDLHSIEDATVGNVTVISTGIAVKIPDGHVGLIRDRSGLAVRAGITVLAGVIDADYTGEVKVVLTSTTMDTYLPAGDRIAQLVVVPCVMEGSQWVDDLAKTERGDGGFGSTGGNAVEPDDKERAALTDAITSYIAHVQDEAKGE